MTHSCSWPYTRYHLVAVASQDVRVVLFDPQDAPGDRYSLQMDPISENIPLIRSPTFEEPLMSLNSTLALTFRVIPLLRYRTQG